MAWFFKLIFINIHYQSDFLDEIKSPRNRWIEQRMFGSMRDTQVEDSSTLTVTEIVPNGKPILSKFPIEILGRINFFYWFDYIEKQFNVRNLMHHLRKLMPL